MPGYPTDRVLVYNRDATFAFELTPDEQRSRLRVEQINDEHSLTIKTTRKLSEGMRLITQDVTGKIREHVVYKPDEGHHEGKYAIGTYLCMWSLQYDLMGSYAVAAGKGCVMIGVSDWERLSLVVEHWHGEVDAEVVMDDTRVVARRVNFLAHVGSSTVTRRFDWAEDLTSIERHEDPGPYYCRVVPLGRGQREYAEDDETEFDWPLDISEETPDGRVYIEDAESALVFRTKLPDGTWHYPTKVVHYDEDDPELLLNAALDDLSNHTRPGVSYEANVLQFVRAGMDAKGVQLGDNTQCVDFGFSPDAGLTVEGRITRLEVEELAPETETNLTIGDLAPTFAQTMRELVTMQTQGIYSRVNHIEGGGTIVYLQHLLDEINAEINGTGGYSYLVPGEGIITYDRRVADPLIGIEATQVTQIKGGNIRIANSKPSFSGINDWNWKTVIVSGHLAAELVTAANIVAGYIGNASAGSYWDLDNNELRIATGAQIGDTTVAGLLQDVASAGISKIEYGVSSSSSTAPTSWSTTVPSSVAKGSWLWVRTTYKDGGTTTSKAYAGTDGVGVKSIVPQYYLSTSSTSATGGSWSNNPPTWSANHYIWTRSYITWDTTPSTTSTTTAVYDAALTQANQKAAQAIADAAEAAKVATNYLTFDSTNGLDVGYSGTNAKTRIKGDGVEIFDGSGVSGVSEALFTGTSARIGRSDKEHITITPSSGINMYDSSGSTSVLFAGVSGSNSIVRVGKQTGSGNVVMSSEGYVDVRNASTVIAHFGYGTGRNHYEQTIYAPYYTFGMRKANSLVDSYSLVEGYNNVAENYCTHAEGWDNSATGQCSHVEGCDCTSSHFATHAEGESCTASGRTAHAEGTGCTASGKYSHAGGVDCKASGNSSFAHGDTCEARRTGDAAFGNGTIADCLNGGISQFVVGDYNIVSTNKIFIVGCGYSDNDRRSALTVDTSGNLWIKGSLPQSSDRRLKEHHAYLGDDACDFIRKLKPALYTKDGTRHVGFYAQDVQEAEPDEWDTVTVTVQHTDESLDFDPLALDYTALVAPLVAYAQQLERRIDQQQQAIEVLTKRLDALEGR